MPSKTFLINKRDNRRYVLNGCIPSTRLPEKQQLCGAFNTHMMYQADQLPPKVDLRPDMTPVEYQADVASCVANAFAGAYEYLTKKSNGYNTDVSRLFIYYNARVKGNTSGWITDSGCTLTNAIEALHEMGTSLESIWPYEKSNVNSRPDPQAYQQAAEHKITEALQVNVDLNEMKSCLAQGFPFAFGLVLYTSFDAAAQTGVVPMPNSGDSSRGSHGRHAMLAVGYSNQSNAFIVRNSWGETWGDQGYCYIPYAYLTNSQLCSDCWTIRKVANQDFGKSHWCFDDDVNYVQRQLADALDFFPYSGNLTFGGTAADDNNCTIQVIDEDDDYPAPHQNGQSNDHPNYNHQNQHDRNKNNGFNPGEDSSYRRNHKQLSELSEENDFNSYRRISDANFNRNVYDPYQENGLSRHADFFYPNYNQNTYDPYQDNNLNPNGGFSDSVNGENPFESSEVNGFNRYGGFFDANSYRNQYDPYGDNSLNSDSGFSDPSNDQNPSENNGFNLYGGSFDANSYRNQYDPYEDNSLNPDGVFSGSSNDDNLSEGNDFGLYGGSFDSNSYRNQYDPYEENTLNPDGGFSDPSNDQNPSKEIGSDLYGGFSNSTYGQPSDDPNSFDD